MNTTHDYFIDLFCGAGGVTTGIHMTTNGRVIACVNHDANAILSHSANHPNVLHFTEDIRTLDLSEIVKLVLEIRAKDPLARIHIWASLECTNFSKAKGGLPREADSRTLANELFRYMDAINPDHIWIENVREFMSWGPLDSNGKPISKLNGQDYVRWCNKMQSYGYDFDWRLLCCADYGDFTSRTRYFAQFVRKGLQVQWPKPTHAKRSGGALFQQLKPWNPVREVLDLKNYGQSIFTRKKPLVEATLKRIYAGLVKFIANGDDSFIMQYYSGKLHLKVKSLDEPAAALTTVPHEVLVQPVFLTAAYGGQTEQRVHSLDSPSPTITVQQRVYAVMIQYNGDPQAPRNVHSIEKPSITLTSKDRLGLVQFMTSHYSSGSHYASIDNPSRTIMPRPKEELTTAQFLINPQYDDKGRSLDDPCFTLIARMDKMPPGMITAQLVTCKGGQMGIVIYPNDSDTMIKIKYFMAHYGIMDIMMRMLTIDELKKITGLPVGYVLYGTEGEKKKFIGNAVPTFVVKAMVEAYQKINQHE